MLSGSATAGRGKRRRKRASAALKTMPLCSLRDAVVEHRVDAIDAPLGGMPEYPQ